MLYTLFIYDDKDDLVVISSQNLGEVIPAQAEAINKGYVTSFYAEPIPNS